MIAQVYMLVVAHIESADMSHDHPHRSQDKYEHGPKRPQHAPPEGEYNMICVPNGALHTDDAPVAFGSGIVKLFRALVRFILASV
jgi:hypothetical protein